MDQHEPWDPTSDVLFRRREALAESFRPGAPIDVFALFFGRQPQMSNLLDVARQRGQHAVIFGERGVGKTSLASLVQRSRNYSGHLGARMSCSSGATFSEIWDSAFEALRIETEAQRIRQNRERYEGVRVNCELALTTLARAKQYVQQRGSRVADVLNGLRLVAEVAPVFIVIDEIDRSASAEVRLPLADLVKGLSDEGLPITLVVVGVADNVVDLIGEHPSIARSMRQIHMQRMELGELSDIVRTGFSEAEMGVSEESVDRIVRLSNGLPHYTHLLAQQAGFAALAFGSDFVAIENVEAAIESALEQAQGTVIEAYTTAVATSRPGAQYREVLLACARAERNDLGEFDGPAVRKALTEVMGRPADSSSYSRHLKVFCERGVLQKRGGAGRPRYRFKDPLLQPYILMKGATEGAGTV